MKINNVSSNQIISIYNNKVQRVEGKASDKNKDVVEISSLGRKLSNYEVNHVNDTSIEKLNKIRDKVKAGTYNTDPKLIASKMLDIMKNRDI